MTRRDDRLWGGPVLQRSGGSRRAGLLSRHRGHSRQPGEPAGPGSPREGGCRAVGGAGSGSGGPFTSGVAAILRPLAEAIGSGRAGCAAEPGIEAGRAFCLFVCLFVSRLP